MKVKNPSGREFYIQPAKDDRMANWCSRVSPVILEFDGVRAEAYADPARSDWIYIRFNDTTYCHWAKQAGGFELLGETSLRISDAGRTYRKRDRDEGGDGKRPSSKKDGDDRSLTREDLDAVVSLLPELCEAVTDRAADPATNSHEYSGEFSSVVRQIVNEFHTRPFMYAFDYLSWMDEGRHLMEDSEALASADLETIRKLLVCHWRSDYWDTDNEHWEQIAANGHLVAMLERLQEIAQGMEPETPIATVLDDHEGEELSMVLSEGSDSTGVENEWPTVAELVAGFDRIREKITPQQMKMLRAHYSSGGRSVTMRELGTASGYGDYKTANVQYGSLAKRLYQAIGYPAPRSTTSGKQYWVTGLGEFVSRQEFGLELHCVMRPEIAEALEKVGIVEAPERIYMQKVNDIGIQDYIVYHNPDVMGPLADEPTFEVFTNKSVSQAKAGDRVWLITGEGTPRKFSIGCWFYIDEFKSGDNLGFKHCVSGSDGEAFSPFIEIEQDEWFTQLKQDQGNFAFGFSRITTSGAVENLAALADGSRNESGSEKEWLDSIYSTVNILRGFTRECLANGDELNATSKLFVLLDKEDFLLKVDDEEWAQEAARLRDRNELKNAGLLTIRGVLSYHAQVWWEREVTDSYIELTKRGYFLAILDRLHEILEGPRDRDQDTGYFPPLYLSDLEIFVTFHSSISDTVEHIQLNPDDRSNDMRLISHVSKMEFFLGEQNVFIDFDVEAWADEGRSLSADSEAIARADLLTIRKLLSYHRKESSKILAYDDRDLQYWADLARNGNLIAVLARLKEIHDELAGRTVIA